MADQYKDDSSATYRGYRRQALYSLFRLFDDGLPQNCTVQPEGHEDLAIYTANGELIEVVQVKDYTANLTTSVLHRFFHRNQVHCESGATVDVKIASFGPVGPELLKALDNKTTTPSRPLDSLMKDREVSDSNGNITTVPGMSLEEAKCVFSHVVLEHVNEEVLIEEIVNRLKNTMTSGDPLRAFENLMWWLISAAERRRKLTRDKVIEKVSEIGKFLDYRAAHEHEWNISIKPILYPLPDQLDEQQLKREFFQGGRVRSEHVAAGLDVPRTETLHELHKLFQQENVVILRAASGQGKTTLALRYLRDWLPLDFRFEVLQAADFQHARRMSAAIAGHSEALDVPTIVYVDVRPGDTLWVEFVRELSRTPEVRVLVTIREEDWFRSRATRDDFPFSELVISFDEETGRVMYGALRDNGFATSQLDFTDAWSQLGDRKTLFEFVYLTTQNEQLAEKIKAQISSIRDQVNCGDLTENELQLLRLIAIASAYEARLNLKSLILHVDIPDPARSLERFSNEYLIRTSRDGQLAEGYHAIRSEIIARELSDGTFNPRGELEALVVPLVVEDDLESFLLCSFSRSPESAGTIVKQLSDTHLNCWVGVRAVFVALQWLGLKEYANANVAVIENVRAIFGGGWWFTLDWDLARVRGKDGFNVLDSLSHISNEMKFAADSVSTVRSQQTDKKEVFSYAVNWLSGFDTPANEPSDVGEFTSLAEVLYWMGHLGVANRQVTRWLSNEIVDQAWKILPIHLFAEFACGVRQFRTDLYTNWLNSHRKQIENMLRQKAGIFAFEEEEDCLVAHYLIDIDKKASELNPRSSDVSVNDLSVERVEVISRCIPGYEKYGVNGYGHRMTLFGNLDDDSNKRMPLENILMPWLPDFNALARGAVEFRFRPQSWSEYFERVRNMRRSVIVAFRDLKRASGSIKSRGAGTLSDTTSWDNCLATVKADFFLPANAVDEWGYVTESRASQSTGSPVTTKFSAISTLDPYNKAVNEYTRTVGNFMQQAIDAMVLVPNLSSAMTEQSRKAVLAKAKELHISENSVRLSIVNGFDACSALFKLHYIEQELCKLGIDFHSDDEFRQEEVNEFLDTMRSWAMFCYPNQMLQKSKKKRKHKARVPKRKLELGDCLATTRKRIRLALKKLKPEGITAGIISEQVQWDNENALWIGFDTKHPLSSLVAIEHIWFSLVEAFRPDREKIVRIQAIDLFWEKIVLVPTVNGKSVEKQAFPNMNGVAYPLDENPEHQQWRFTPELIPETAWKKLKLQNWEHHPSWKPFDEFAAAYGALLLHVDHLADFSRCTIDLDETGEKILLDYITVEQKRAELFLQETFDSCARLLKEFPELDESIVDQRPDILQCLNLIVSMKDAIYPIQDFDQQFKMTIDQIVEWRERLKEGANLLSEARCLWIADSLGFDSFDYPENGNSS